MTTITKKWEIVVTTVSGGEHIVGGPKNTKGEACEKLKELTDMVRNAGDDMFLKISGSAGIECAIPVTKIASMCVISVACYGE